MMNDQSQFEALKPVEIDQLFLPVSKHPAKTTIWTEEKDVALETKVKSFERNNELVHVGIPCDKTEDDFVIRLEKATVDSCFINIELAGAKIFFPAIYRGKKSELYLFRSKGALYRLQRRAQARFTVMDSDSISLGSEQIENPEILDLSLSGIGLVTPSTLTPKTTLKNAQLFIDGETFDVDLDIKYKAEFRGKFRYGMMFNQLPLQSEKLIQRWIMKKTKNLLGRI